MSGAGHLLGPLLLQYLLDEGPALGLVVGRLGRRVPIPVAVVRVGGIVDVRGDDHVVVGSRGRGGETLPFGDEVGYDAIGGEACGDGDIGIGLLER